MRFLGRTKDGLGEGGHKFREKTVNKAVSYAIVMFDCPSAGEEEMASKIEAGLGFCQTHIMEHQRVKEVE